MHTPHVQRAYHTVTGSVYDVMAGMGVYVYICTHIYQDMHSYEVIHVHIYTYASDIYIYIVIYIILRWKCRYKRNTNTFDDQKRTPKLIRKRLLACERGGHG
jgi:hypothetical protein